MLFLTIYFAVSKLAQWFVYEGKRDTFWLNLGDMFIFCVLLFAACR